MILVILAFEKPSYVKGIISMSNRRLNFISLVLMSFKGDIVWKTPLSPFRNSDDSKQFNRSYYTR